MDGAQEAFAIIVEAFAAGDRETLKDLLGPAVYHAFEAAITAREGRGEKQETQIRAIRKAEAIGSGSQRPEQSKYHRALHCRRSFCDAGFGW